jgi:rhodanese-related sulfurtransferase
MAVLSADHLLWIAREGMERVEPGDLASLHDGGALIVDIRPEAQRRQEGDLPFGLVVERNVLEWRFDLQGAHSLPEVTGYDQPVVIVCSEGYASSLAAASLRQLGFTDATDLAGGYLAWRELPDSGQRERAASFATSR